MFRTSYFSGRRTSILLGILAGIGVIVGLAFLRGGGEPTQSFLARRGTGAPQLISVEPILEPEGALCAWVPVSATTTLAAALQQGPLAARLAAAAPTEAARLEASKRKPLRKIQDPYAAFSSVAVDPIRNEVVLTDENLKTIVVYDRRANTPPTASMTEPKRIIGGPQTGIEFQCGIYLDPGSGDIYVLNNDIADNVEIFGRQAQGDVPPDREVHTPHGIFGIAVDEKASELFLTVQHTHAVIVYRKMAEKEEAPLRLLQGDQTQLADPHGIALDLDNKLMFVTNHGSVHQIRPGDGSGEDSKKANWPSSSPIPGTGKNLPPSITVYPMDAKGNTPALRVIQGPKTQMNWPTGITWNPQRGELYVANDMGDSLLVFDATANGDVAPLRVLKGPKTMIKNPTGVFLDTRNDELWVANFGNHSTTVYKPTAGGDTPPLRVIRSSPLGDEALIIGNPGTVGYDSKRQEILVPN